MKNGKELAFVAIIAAALLTATAAAADQGITMSFAASEVIVKGITPGAPAAIFSVANDPGPFYRTLVRRERFIAADAQGIATYSVPEGVSNWSIWFAVDVRTGDYAVAAPGGALRPSLPVPKTDADASGGDILEFQAESAYVFIVQRGSGAWVGSMAKGSAQDLNRTGGTLRAGTSSFRSFDKSNSHPGRLTPADVLVIVDLHTMQYYAGRVVGR